MRHSQRKQGETDRPVLRRTAPVLDPTAPNYPPYCYIENDRTLGIPTKTKPVEMHGVPGVMLEKWDLVGVLPEIESRAVGYIDDRAKSKEPFFLYFPLTAPHTPIAPTEEHLGKSRAGRYGDFVHQVDSIVGHVVSALERNRLAENTLLIFTSDNGSPRMDGTDKEGALDSVLKFDVEISQLVRVAFGLGRSAAIRAATER